MAIIGDRETISGFALGGVSMRLIVEDVTQAEEALASVMESGEVAVLLLTPKYGFLREQIESWREQRPVYPLVVELPPRRGEKRGEDRIVDLVRRAVGVHLEDSNIHDEKSRWNDNKEGE
ncbi:MAG: V-type ATP synthase subunit F [Candidatus Thermoplasmatota archaeon]|nr:V-type ATP synthase subunit F [Candidatus Thermoplasmatota archaeon]